MATPRMLIVRSIFWLFFCLPLESPDWCMFLQSEQQPYYSYQGVVAFTV